MKEKFHYKLFFSLVENDKNENDKKISFCYDPSDNENEIPFVIHWLLEHNDKFEKTSKDDKFYPIWIYIHSTLELLKGQSSYEDEDDIFYQKSLVGEKQTPIIHLTMSDLFVDTLFGNSPLPTDVPRSYMIMDNSIWNYLVPFSETYYIHNFAEYNQHKNDIDDNVKKKLSISQNCISNFYEAIHSICKNYQKNLYRLKVSQEYADLNARLTKQSYLSGAHASGVSPFIFHSEMAAKQLIQREFRLKEDSPLFPYDMRSNYELGSLMDDICKHKWRILLLDDKAIEPMDTEPFESDKDKERGGWNCKKSIITTILEGRLNLGSSIGYCPCVKKDKKETTNLNLNKLPNKDTTILIEYAQSLKEAKDALEKKKYDLVLIDYLLNQKNGTHYGYELLEEIWNDQQQHKKDEDNLRFKVLPHRSQRLYCMFISAYSYAVHDRLLAEGLNQSEDYWFINLGACPTNTPQLFLYNLLKLMQKRLDDSGILELSSKEIHKLINRIYLPKEQDARGDSVRKKANTLYQKVLSLQYHYRNILKDIEIPFGQNASDFDTKGSVLMTNFIQKKINLGGMLEHLTQLVHLTAFGTIRQCQEMWEEYIYFKALFEKQLDDVSIDDFNKLCQNIEKYILELKSQQQ